MIDKVLFALRRAIFLQHRGMVFSIVKSKLLRSPRRGSVGYKSPAIDVQYGIDTAGIISAGALRAGKKGDFSNFGYEGCKPSVVRAAISSIPDLRNSIFLDIGCGKGRALAVASEFPFRRIIGVELSAPLADVAKANALRIAGLFPERTTVEVVNDDATSFDFPAGYLIAFMYNPAYRPVIKTIAKRFASRLDKTLVIYNQPMAGKIFDDHRSFTRYFTARLDSSDEELCEGGARIESVVMWQTTREPHFAPHVGAGKAIRYQAGMGNID